MISRAAAEMAGCTAATAEAGMGPEAASGGFAPPPAGSTEAVAWKVSGWATPSIAAADVAWFKVAAGALCEAAVATNVGAGLGMEAGIGVDTVTEAAAIAADIPETAPVPVRPFASFGAMLKTGPSAPVPSSGRDVLIPGVGAGSPCAGETPVPDAPSALKPVPRSAIAGLLVARCSELTKGAAGNRACLGSGAARPCGFEGGCATGGTTTAAALAAAAAVRLLPRGAGAGAEAGGSLSGGTDEFPAVAAPDLRSALRERARADGSLSLGGVLVGTVISAPRVAAGILGCAISSEASQGCIFRAFLLT